MNRLEYLTAMVINQAIKINEADENYEVCQRLLNYSNSNQMDIDMIKFERVKNDYLISTNSDREISKPFAIESK